MSQPSTFRNLWYRWKSLRLPWRRKWLCGFDLQGNTFWEFQNALSPGGRPRRIAQYPRSTHHGDVHLTPAWMQWLRHTRVDAPTVQQQQMELQRQEQLKELADEADRRWEQKESFLDAPEKTGQTPPPLLPKRDAVRHDPGGPESIMSPVKSESEQVREMENQEQHGTSATHQEKQRQQSHQKQDPWTRRAPSEGWQPGAWTPGKVEKR